MSYGKVFKINNVEYLIEIFDKHIYIAKIINQNKEEYSDVYEGDYNYCFWNEDLEKLQKLKNDEHLYAILVVCLNWLNTINSLASYQEYIYQLLNDGHTKEDILTNSSDELLIYAMYFPLDIEAVDFKRIATSIIDGYKE